MKLLEREIQRQLLLRLAEDYPNPTSAGYLEALAPGNAARVNIAYLAELGLVRARCFGDLELGNQLMQAVITAKGMDFLADDGGLSAILGVVTVKLHEDTLKELIAAQIQSSDLPQSEKKRFLDQLRELPAETTKHLALKLVDAGLENWTKALPLLQSMLGS